MRDNMYAEAWYSLLHQLDFLKIEYLRSSSEWKLLNTILCIMDDLIKF